MNEAVDEGVLDPYVREWLDANPMYGAALEELSPEILELARSPIGAPPTREIAHVTDELAEGVPVRIYQQDGEPTGLVVYFHGGGFCIGSIGLMDNVARELTHATGAVVVSVEYRLAPEHPYPEGLDDCETVTRWAVANVERFGVAPGKVVVAGESAGGNLSAALALRLRDAGDVALAGQVLLYPGVAGGRRDFASIDEFDGIILTKGSLSVYWEAYSGGRDIDDDPGAAPLNADSLRGLPPALVILAGGDLLRDEGRAYATRLREEGVDVEEVCCAGQPHGFLNFGLPAAAPAYEKIGTWVRSIFSGQRSPAARS